MTIKKIFLIAGALLTAVVAACILVYRMLTSGQVEPLALLLLAAVISIMLPVIRANFFPGTRDCEAEFNFHLRRQEAYIQQQISDKLGPAVFQQISIKPDDSNGNPADYLLSLLEKKEGRSDADLRFALLVALSRYCEHAGDPGAAVESLTEALESRPRDFITRFLLARNYEWQGNMTGALDAYRRILDAPAGLSRAMIKLTRRRMEALEAR